AGDRGLGGLAVLFALDLDQVGRNAAEHVARDHRLVDEADAGDMRPERAPQRDGEISRKVLRMSARQVDDNILDHGLTLLARSVPAFARNVPAFARNVPAFARSISAFTRSIATQSAPDRFKFCDGPRRRSAAARAGSLGLAVLVELAEIGPEVADLLGIL